MDNVMGKGREKNEVNTKAYRGDIGICALKVVESSTPTPIFTLNFLGERQKGEERETRNRMNKYIIKVRKREIDLEYVKRWENLNSLQLEIYSHKSQPSFILQLNFYREKSEE